MSRLESDFKTALKKELLQMFPGCYVFYLDPNTIGHQGIPDLLILWRDRWALLEAKRKTPTKASDFQPNQEWYIEEFDNMSFSACIYPENKEAVLNDLQQAFLSRRSTRIAKRV